MREQKESKKVRRCFFMNLNNVKSKKSETQKFLDMLSDYDIIAPLELQLSERAAELGIGYLTPEVERDADGVKIVMRIASMVENAGASDFMTDPNLKTIEVEYLDYDRTVIFDVKEAVPVSGMEIEVIYRPRI